MKKLAFILPSFLLTAGLFAQSPELRKKAYNLEKSGLAIEGYDAVAYFTEHKAVEGSKEFTAAYNGVTYRFSTSKNRDLFNASPAKYEPQYGGWCAYAMGATGERVDIDPETFKILDGKLYLFYNKLFNNTLPKWNQDEARLKNSADRNWPKYIK